MSASFLQSQVDAILAELLLPFNTPLSVLAVELFNQEGLVIPEQKPAVSATHSLKEAAAGGTAVATMEPTVESQPGATRAEAINDPLGGGLGSQRILRTSPLTPVGPIC